MVSGYGFGQNPTRRTARKKGSGYENALRKNKNYCNLIPEVRPNLGPRTQGITFAHPLLQARVFPNLVPRACDPREGTRGSGIIRCRKPGILAKIELRIPFQLPIRFLSETDYPRASRSFPRIAGSGNEIGSFPARFHNRSGE